MELLTTIEYNGTEIRVYGEKFNPQFCGSDIATALGYDDIPASLRGLAPYEKQFIPGGGLVISEFGVASLATGAYFRQWFSTEVLPSIHRYGYYKQQGKKYERLYKLESGERLNKADLSNRAISYGMPKTEAKRSSIKMIVEFVNYKEKQISEEETFAKEKANYPYNYDDIDEKCHGNLTVLWRVLPKNSYIQYNGQYYFSERAVHAINKELETWK